MLANHNGVTARGLSDTACPRPDWGWQSFFKAVKAKESNRPVVNLAPNHSPESLGVARVSED